MSVNVDATYVSGPDARARARRPRHFVTVAEARLALDCMDDCARMADIDPYGPRGVLEQFIDQVSGVQPKRQAVPVAPVVLIVNDS